MMSNCELSLSHWYPWSGVVLDLSIPDLCALTYFDLVNNDKMTKTSVTFKAIGIKLLKELHSKVPTLERKRKHVTGNM